MAIFEGFDIEKLGSQLPSAESLMQGLKGWVTLLVLIGPLLMLGFGIYYLFFSPKEANHSAGYRFFYAMSQVQVWQYAQRLAGFAYSVLGGVLLVIIGLVSLSFGAKPAPDMVWLAAKCLLWEVILAIIVTLAVDALIITFFDIKGNPRKSSAKLLNRKRNAPARRRPGEANTRSQNRP